MRDRPNGIDVPVFSIRSSTHFVPISSTGYGLVISITDPILPGSVISFRMLFPSLLRRRAAAGWQKWRLLRILLECRPAGMVFALKYGLVFRCGFTGVSHFRFFPVYFT
jgi:hypothetical protein